MTTAKLIYLVYTDDQEGVNFFSANETLDGAKAAVFEHESEYFGSVENPDELKWKIKYDQGDCATEYSTEGSADITWVIKVVGLGS